MLICGREIKNSVKEEDVKDEELVDDKSKSVEIPSMVSVDWESGPLRERPGINFSESEILGVSKRENQQACRDFGAEPAEAAVISILLSFLELGTIS